MTFGAGSYLTSAGVEFFGGEAHVLIGRYSSLAQRICFLINLNHTKDGITTYPFRTLQGIKEKSKHEARANHMQIIIGNDVWIGAGATLLGGVRIGNGAVIGAGAVVAKDIPPYAVAVGNPVRIIKYRFTQEIIDKLQTIKWWNWEHDKILANLPLLEEPEQFVTKFYQAEVEEEDELTEAVRKLRTDGYHIYYFIPDFRAEIIEDATWRRFICAYLERYSYEDKVVLIMPMQEEADGEKARELIASYGEKTARILTHGGDEEFSLGILRLAHTYVTTKEAIASIAVDYAVDRSVAIRYGLDDPAQIFS